MVRSLLRPSSALGFAALVSLTACGSSDDEGNDLTNPGDPEERDEDTQEPPKREPPTTPEPPTAPLACDQAPPNTSALTLNGEDSFVSMGVAPELGLEKFTVEAWILREGYGRTMNTGVGGLYLVPIAGKGRGENDDTIYNCNYAFGLAGDVFGADFEDMQNGGNHPIVGRTKVPFGEWHHGAVSYDGEKWQLFFDGELDAEQASGAVPRHDSIQHFAIGSALNSMGAPAGYFHGKIDEVRVWDRARSAAEIRASLFERITSAQPGLVARWGLDSASGSAVTDSINGHDGEIAGQASFSTPGAVLDVGLPPTIVSQLPAAGAEVTGASTKLTLTIDDADSEIFAAKFYVRELTEVDDFTLVVLPDTQNYTRNNLQNYYYGQTDWIMANAGAYNIKGVIHNGDIVNTATVASQWTIARNAMNRLERTSPAFPEGMPYGLCAGNHDQNENGAVDNTTIYNSHFGTARFGGRSYFGGTYRPNLVNENWVVFNAGDLDVVVANFQFSGAERTAPVLNWGLNLFRQYPDALGVINSHSILTTSGTDSAGNPSFSPAGRSLFNGIARHTPNVQLMTCGHVRRWAHRSDTIEGSHTVHSMVADWQFEANGGNGYLRLWEISPKNNEVTVRSYSPALDRFDTSPANEFTLKVDMKGGSSAPFEVAGTADSSDGGSLEANLELGPGRTYEWYAQINDCHHTITTPRQRFTVPAAP